MSLTGRVLALHEGISEAFILEERGGQLLVVEEASRNRAATLANFIGEWTESRALGPAIILGAANQFSKTPDSLRLVGILYRDVGIILTQLGENKLLAISAETRTFSNTMQLVNEALPDLMKELETSSPTPGAVKSAPEAGEIARAYVSQGGKLSAISLEEITYHASNHRWEIHGKYRTHLFTPSKNFQVEVDGDAGTIVTYRSSSRSSALFTLEIVALFGALILASWMVYVYVNLMGR